MLYFVFFITIYPFLKIRKILSKKTNKNLIIQTAAIGDYVNSSVIFDKINFFDIVTKEINLSFCDYDSRINKKFVVDDIKNGKISKFNFIKNIILQNYENVYILMPNSLNLFMGKCTLAKNIVTISHYNTKINTKLLNLGMKKIVHTRDNLTLKTYLKMINEIDGEKSIQKPYLVPKVSILPNNKKFKIGISLSAGNKIKTPPKETWDQILKILSKFNCEIYIFGIKEEIDFLKNLNIKDNKVISLIDKIPLCELPFYISKMNLYISSDTGNHYIADTMKVSTINLIGPCFASEQRGVYNTLIIESKLNPISSVFDTVRNIDASKYFSLTEDDKIKIENFTSNLYKSFLHSKDNYPY